MICFLSLQNMILRNKDPSQCGKLQRLTLFSEIILLKSVRLTPLVHQASHLHPRANKQGQHIYQERKTHERLR